MVPSTEYIYFQTWFIHYGQQLTCQHPRPVRLTNEIISWADDLRRVWSDRLDGVRPIHFHVVQPTPPQSPLQSFAGHLILEQAPLARRSAIVTTTLFESFQGNALMQHAKSVPRYVTSEDIAQEY